MGGSAGRGWRVCIENDLTTWMKNLARFSATGGGGGERMHGGSGGGIRVGLGKDCVIGVLGLAGRTSKGRGVVGEGEACA
jgi:hypothetical protein